MDWGALIGGAVVCLEHESQGKLDLTRILTWEARCSNVAEVRAVVSSRTADRYYTISAQPRRHERGVVE